jgi:hypothetical protein
MTLIKTKSELNKNQQDETRDPNESFTQQKKAPTQREKRLAMALRQNLSKRKLQQRERLSESAKSD